MSVDLHTKDSFMIPSQVNEILCSNHEGNKDPFMDKHKSYSSFASLDFGSSVESELSSTSTDCESDQEEDFVAELTRQMAHSMLQEDDIQHKRAWDVSGFSESTLQKEETKVGKFDYLKRSEEMNQYHIERFYSTSLKAKQTLIDEQIKAIQLCKLKQQQIIKQQEEQNCWGKQENGSKQYEQRQQYGKFQSKVGGFSACGVSRGHQRNKMSWSNFQQQQHRPTGSEIRAVFLNEPGSRTSSSGTGVFLPRGIGNTSESRKKPAGCSTVLIPAKVIQALKLQFDKMDVNSRPSGARNFLFQQDSVYSLDTSDNPYGLHLHQKSQSETVPALNHNQEHGLPHEWTY